MQSKVRSMIVSVHITLCDYISNLFVRVGGNAINLEHVLEHVKYDTQFAWNLFSAIMANLLKTNLSRFPP